MAAGLGFKDFTTGEVLTAADVDGYLMQGVWVFASATARDATVTSPQEGNFAYLKDTNVTTYYTGSAWANLDTTGMTNPMTTTGDTIYSSSGSTPARLGIGSTGQVLTVAGGVPSWATPAAGGGMTLLTTTTLSGASTTSATFSSAYKQINIYIKQFTLSSGTENFFMRLNADTGSNYSFYKLQNTATVTQSISSTSIEIGQISAAVNAKEDGYFFISIMNPSDTDSVYLYGIGQDAISGTMNRYTFTGVYDSSAAITSVTFFPGNGSFGGGTAYIYGVN